MKKQEYHARLQKPDSVVDGKRESGDKYLGTFPPAHVPEYSGRHLSTQVLVAADRNGSKYRASK